MLDQVPLKKDILAAQKKIAGLVHHTPVLTSGKLDRLAGCHLYFKCENFQKVGAFKARGAIHAALSLSSEQLRYGIATHSSGNHAQAIAYAASILNIPAYIVMPKNAPGIKISAVKDYGAEIIFCDPTLEAREKTLSEVVKKTSAHFIHPYNDYSVIAGQATAAYELLDEIPGLNALLTPVGGGGLLSGTILSRDYFSPDTRVFAGEPAGADDAFRSLRSGKIQPSTAPVTIADGLLTSLGEKTFDIIKRGVEDIILVDDDEIIAAMRLLWERMKIIVEPSGAVPFAALLREKEKFAGQSAGIILSGGNVDLNKQYFT